MRAASALRRAVTTTASPFFAVSAKANPPMTETFMISRAGSAAMRDWPYSITSAYGPAAVSMVTVGGTIGSRTSARFGLTPASSSRSASAASSPRSRMSRCGLVR